MQLLDTHITRYSFETTEQDDEQGGDDGRIVHRSLTWRVPGKVQVIGTSLHRTFTWMVPCEAHAREYEG